MNSKIESKLLTEVELELMTTLWEIGEGTVSQVMEGPPPLKRKLAYTSVSTILRILEQKNILKTKKIGKGHIYIPTITKEEYQAKTIKHMVERVFEGTPVSLVKSLLNTEHLSEEELIEIKKLINQNNKDRNK